MCIQKSMNSIQLSSIVRTLCDLAGLSRVPVSRVEDGLWAEGSGKQAAWDSQRLACHWEEPRVSRARTGQLLESNPPAEG